MAYNASIAEQFEIIQRWMTGGNTPTSSGGTAVFGGQRDPLLGLPHADGTRTYRFIYNKRVVRIDLGAKPFVTLDWGLYLFTPSIPALRKLARAPERDDTTRETVVQRGEAALQMPMLMSRDVWAGLLEDISAKRSGTSRAIFEAIRNRHGGALRTPYGVLVVSRELAMDVLMSDGPDDRESADSDAEARKPVPYSVCEYQNRFRQSVGENHLGLDRGAKYDEESRVPNASLQAVSEEDAFTAAYEATHDELDEAISSGTGKPVTVELRPVVEQVLARLGAKWFDLPDGKFMRPGGEPDSEPHDDVRCPHDFLAPSRYVFSSPNPRPTVEQLGQSHGTAIRHAAEQFVNSNRTLKGAIAAKLQENIADREKLSHVLLQLMFGFIPTVYGNILQLLDHWVEDRSLWRVQQRVRAGIGQPYEVASSILRPDMEKTLLDDPMPLLLHRTVQVERRLGPVTVSPGDRIVLCMAGITGETLADGNPDIMLMFGGDRSKDPGKRPTHACPGRDIATGVMLGMLMALFSRELLPARPPLTLQVDPEVHPAPTPTYTATTGEFRFS